MDASTFNQTPFSALTFVAAPALLTNASSVLVLSTINRMLRTWERMHELFTKSQAGEIPEDEVPHLIEEVNRVERQAALLLRALRFIYIALASFAAATLVTLLGAGVGQYHGGIWLRLLVGLGVLLGLIGVSGIVFGCIHLFQSTQLSLINIRYEASLIRQRQVP
jgi:Protein of unknown function (DUF2721)